MAKKTAFKKPHKSLGHHTGWHPDHPDQRDFLVEKPGKAVLRKLAPTFSLRKAMPAVYDQGQEGSCTAQATCSVLQFLEIIETKDLQRPVPARNFQYFNTRALQHTTDQDSGGTLRNALKAVARWGYCAEDLWPYNQDTMTTPPGKPAYAEAARHRLGYLMYARVQQDVGHLKNVLATGHPVVFGFTVYQSFMNTGSDGLVVMPDTSEQPLGGHAVALIGYDDTKGCFEVRNSWGPSWGDQGYFWMPYGYVLNSSLADDFWTVMSTPKPDSES